MYIYWLDNIKKSIFISAILKGMVGSVPHRKPPDQGINSSDVSDLFIFLGSDHMTQI